MGGQDGFSRDLLTYTDESLSLLGGINCRAGKLTCRAVAEAHDDGCRTGVDVRDQERDQPPDICFVSLHAGFGNLTHLVGVGYYCFAN